MNLQALISRFRTDANDKAAPYFWSDADVTAWLNDAVNEAAIRGRLIHESSNPGMCKINIVPGQSVYSIHPTMFELDYLTFKATGESKGNRVWLMSQDDLNDDVPDWRDRTGDPTYAVQGDKNLRLAPMPIRAGVLSIEGYRLPRVPMEGMDDSPEINSAHHAYLVQWALHRAFSIPDSEMFDPNRSALAEQEFTRYFGLRPDSDLRRITREDRPHNVKPFWP